MAEEKLANFHTKIGDPDECDYSGLEVRPEDAFGNRVRAECLENEPSRQTHRPAHRPRRVEHDTADGQRLLLDFQRDRIPRGHSRQLPYFDPKASAVKYAAIGGVIGHEMGHD